MNTKPNRSVPDAPPGTPGKAEVRAGSPMPLGAHESGSGVNFAIFTRNATRVRLEFFHRPEDAAPALAIDLDPARNRTGDIWHIWVKGIASAQLYAYRIDGPYEPYAGHRFNVRNLLLDPFATAISHQPHWDFTAALGYDPSSPEKDLAPSTTPARCRNACTAPILSIGRMISRHGIRGRRRSSTKPMSAASPSIPGQGWSTREPSGA
jgi:glycogen operon protein